MSAEVEKSVRIFLQFVQARVLLRQYVANDVCQCVDVPGFDLKCRRCAALAVIEAEVEV